MLFEFAFPYHMPVGLPYSAIVVVILILILMTPVFIQIKEVSKANPVDGLKIE